MNLRIGTRRSRLALAQANEVAARLRAVGVGSQLVPMVTSGDRGAPLSSSKAGLKGLFVAEIVRALQEGQVDLAVHSAKDLPAEDPEGLVVAAVPERADPFDVLVTRDSALSDGAFVGTSSLRRQAQLRRARPRVIVRDLRGNVDTRLAKLEAGEVDAVVLAAAGLKRLGLAPANVTPLSLEEMVPAPGQGALALQARMDDGPTLEALRALDHPGSRATLEAERDLMLRLGGGCALPLGAHATIDGMRVRLVAVVASPSGATVVRVEGEGATPGEASEQAAALLMDAGADRILAAVRGSG